MSVHVLTCIHTLVQALAAAASPLHSFPSLSPALSYSFFFFKLVLSLHPFSPFVSLDLLWLHWASCFQTPNHVYVSLNDIIEVHYHIIVLPTWWQ